MNDPWRVSSTACTRGAISSVRLIFLSLANRNRKFRFVKFSTKTDRNNWESIGFGLFRLWLVSVGFRLRERLLETKQERSWYISESETEKEKRKIKEKNLFVRNEEAGVWSCHGGRCVEAGVWRLVANVDWWRPVCVRWSDGGVWVWETMRGTECGVGRVIYLFIFQLVYV